MGQKQLFNDAIQSIKLPIGGKFLVTGCAGFIGSHVVEALCDLGVNIVGLDNFSSGKKSNLEAIGRSQEESFNRHFELIEGDIRDDKTCLKAMEGVDAVIHLAALGSVPRSIANPRDSIDVNINGYFNILQAARAQNVKRVVFASSSSIYGDDPRLPKLDGQYGRVLSPYAASKRTNELLAESFANCYGMEIVGTRFFNVFGERQNVDGPYAAVIPKWTRAMLNKSDCVIFGDGLTSRDFTYVKNVVYALLLATSTQSKEAYGRTLNVACGSSTSLNDLFDLLKEALGRTFPAALEMKARYEDFRLGDIQHSSADIGPVMELVNYKPLYTVSEGLEICAPELVRTYV